MPLPPMTIVLLFHPIVSGFHSGVIQIKAIVVSAALVSTFMFFFVSVFLHSCVHLRISSKLLTSATRHSI